MRAGAITFGAVTAAVVGLGASIASLVDDLGTTATFCATTGCQTVRHSTWAHPLGIPMSMFGIVFYIGMLVLAFVPAPRLRLWGAIAGAAWAAWLIGLQAFAIGAWCKLCLIADPAAIAHAALVLAGAGLLALSCRRVAAVAVGVAGSVVAFALWTSSPAPATPHAPTVERSEVVTIVEYVDFECPFCRQMAGRLETALAQAQKPVRVVRKMVPLPMHPGAVPAALAWCCADAQGKGEAMARALFAADPAELTPEGCEAIAGTVGCDLARYRADLAGAARRIAGDVQDAQAAGVGALPTLFVGEHVFVGAGATADDLTAAINS